jgi:hypothetical protein
MKSLLTFPLAACLLAAACSARPLATDDAGATGGSSGGTFGLAGAGGRTFTPTNKVDMLFVIDDSSATVRLQQSLVRNFPTLMATLRTAATTPDLRIAVVSSDMGAGDGSIAGCDANGGKKAIFQNTARGTCTATGLAAGATYIIDTGTIRNYEGALEDVFACIAMLGESGCGFEHQLAAAARALGADGLAPPQENQGFLRPDALLAIVIVTNEDDCSAPPGSSLFATTDRTLRSTLGPPANFRCNEFGHLCNGVKPPRLAPNGDTAAAVTLDGCVSAEGAGMLTPIATMAAQFRSLKAFPDEQIVIAAIAGPAQPYTVKWRTPPTADTGPWPEISHACTTDTTFADPAVRIAQLARGFGANGISLSACADNFSPGFERIGELLSRAR